MIKSGEQTAAVWGSKEKPLVVREDVTGKSYKLEFKITYDDGEKLYETEKYVFVKTTAKEKPSEGTGSNGDNGGNGSLTGGNGTDTNPSGGDAGADVFGGVYTKRSGYDRRFIRWCRCGEQFSSKSDRNRI